jgi:hypothetical protein
VKVCGYGQVGYAENDEHQVERDERPEYAALQV